MSKVEHTPGPWKITRNTTPGEFVTDTKVRDKYDGVIAVCHINTAANARLIAAAPELLDALLQALRELEEAKNGLCPDFQTAITAARAAIAKAKGES